MRVSAEQQQQQEQHQYIGHTDSLLTIPEPLYERNAVCDECHLPSHGDDMPLALATQAASKYAACTKTFTDA